MKKYFVLFFLFIAMPCFAQINLVSNDIFSLTLSPYLQTDVISFNNAVDLDSHSKDDRSTYFGIDYSLGFNFNFKAQDQRFFFKLERNGLYDYDAPLFIHDTLTTTGPTHVKAYRNVELLPQLEEFWYELPLNIFATRFKAGLFNYEAGKGYAVGSGSFENYGAMLYRQDDDFSWRIYYFRPDLVYKNRLGPRIELEEEEGIDYQPNAANLFALDATFNLGKNVFQPFISVLSDYTHQGKKTSLFSAPTNRDILGTVGISADFYIKGFSLGLELARNFGQAESSEPAFKNVEHKGYLLYSNATYDFGRFSPHAQFIFSSGNKVTQEMVESGDTTFPNAANKAFSVYSPLNTNLFDCLGPSADSLPLVFFGWGYGLNNGIGVYRPSTFSDDSIYENMVMPSMGFDYKLTEKLSVILDWWYIRANEKGVGMLAGIAKELSRNLGQEIDLTLSFDFNDKMNISLYGGYFWPGEFFKEKRDDVGGSLFTPYVRGDGKADNAYQIELVCSLEF